MTCKEGQGGQGQSHGAQARQAHGCEHVIFGYFWKFDTDVPQSAYLSHKHKPNTGTGTRDPSDNLDFKYHGYHCRKLKVHMPRVLTESCISFESRDDWCHLCHACRGQWHAKISKMRHD